MTSKTIDIARDYSDVPAGRSIDDGDFNGEKFRVSLLAPALRNYDAVTVVLDHTEGFGSSFLEEAFGGLIRKEGFTHSDLQQKLRLVAETKRAYKYKKKAEQVIASARPEA